MQLLVRHELTENLILPINYHHILQAIIYKGLGTSVDYNKFLHDEGFSFGGRSYKLFTFSLLKGKYEIANGKIMFRDEVSFEVRSPDIFMIKKLAENIHNNGIDYGEYHISQVEALLFDETVEANAVQIEMITPICVYTTDPETKKTYFYEPGEQEFRVLVNDNFLRKYTACYDIEPESNVIIEPFRVTKKDKFVTRYKGFYISGWKGIYCLYGERKYLDFLYQTGLGTRNAQGFGMFRIL